MRQIQWEELQESYLRLGAFSGWWVWKVELVFDLQASETSLSPSMFDWDNDNRYTEWCKFHLKYMFLIVIILMFLSAELMRAQLPCGQRAFLRDIGTGGNGRHALRASKSSWTRELRYFDGTQRWRTVALRRRAVQGTYARSAGAIPREWCRKINNCYRTGARYETFYWSLQAFSPLSLFRSLFLPISRFIARSTRQSDTFIRQ